MTYAVRFTARETAELVSVAPDTAPLGPDRIAGRTLASLISPGTELNHGYLGETFPYDPGYAAVIEVEEVGAEVEGITAGDRALAMGTHRGRQHVPAELAVRLPVGLEPHVAVFARLIAVSMTTLTTTAARPPASVGVCGLGPVGHLAAQLFAACGYHVTGCDISAPRRDLMAARGIGVTDRLVEGAGYPLVVECSGHEAAVLDACRAVRKGGEVVLVGLSWKKRADLSAFELLNAVFHNYVQLRSGWEWELPRTPRAFSPSSIRENFAGALRYLGDGRIDPEGLYRLASPAEAQPVYQDLLHQRGPLTAVFDWSATEA